MRIGVFAASGPIDGARFQAGQEILESWGHELRVQPDIQRRLGYLAGTDEQRIEALLEAGRGVDIAMAARGGYGLHRILARVPWEALEAPVLGFSDLTALHLARFAATGRGGWHGPVVSQLGDLRPEELEALRRFLEDPGPVEMSGRGGPEVPVEGTLLGGNLALVSALLGTPWIRWPKDTILVLEDVDEAPYRLDRMMMQLELSGLPDRLQAVALGTFSRCGADGPSVVRERAEAWGQPVLFDLPFGHGDRNRAFGVGARATMSSGKLRVEAP
ncbi:MAG: LD-carboxypeptidase [Myxococcota bacterium]